MSDDLWDDAKTLADLGVVDWIDANYDRELLTKHPVLFIYKPIPHTWREEEFSGFEAKCLDFAGECDGEDRFHVLFEATALWDGVRHLYFGSEKTGNYGYLYYPPVIELALALKRLAELEEQYRSDR